MPFEVVQGRSLKNENNLVVVQVEVLEVDELPDVARQANESILAQVQARETGEGSGKIILQRLKKIRLNRVKGKKRQYIKIKEMNEENTHNEGGKAFEKFFTSHRQNFQMVDREIQLAEGHDFSLKRENIDNITDSR